jgi:uncharacterized MAPEG superfamily protein
MTVPLWSLLGFCAWTIAIVVVGIGRVRVTAVLTGAARANEFPADVPHGDPTYRRVLRAHANCVENLPLFAAVVLVAAVTHVDTPALDALAVTYLVARIAQTVTHIASGSARAISTRFTFFLVQLACLVGMGVVIARA